MVIDMTIQTSVYLHGKILHKIWKGRGTLGDKGLKVMREEEMGEGGVGLG